MKKPLLVFLSLAMLGACRTATIVQGADASSRAAGDRFLAGVRANDAGVVAANWGSREGPASQRMTRQELDQRLYIMMRCLRHDSAKVVADVPGADDARVLRVDLFRGTLTRQTALTTVPTKSGTWYVEQVDMEPVRDFCTR